LKYDKQIKDHFVGHDPNKEYKLFGLDGTKRFHWDIITMCNYHCEYCYSREIANQWNKMTTRKQVDEVISKLRLVNAPLELIILGGEPTKHPYYFYVMDEVYGLDNQLVVMGNITNGIFKNYVEFVDMHEKYKDKFHWNVTFHPSQIKDFEQFKLVIQYIKDSGFNVNINVMLADTQYITETEDMLDYLTANSFRYYFNVVFDHDGVKYRNYDEDYVDWLGTLSNTYGGIKELVYLKDGGVVGRYNDIDVYLNDLSDFCGWKCKNNNFQIGVNGSEIVKFCNWKTMTVKDINDDEDFMICPLEQCVCQGKLTSEKMPE
jgi:organic radical activating enzyme